MNAVIEQNSRLDKMRGGVLLIVEFFLRGLFMKFKKLSTLLFAFVFAFAFLVASCSNGSDDNSSITLSAEATSATVGDVVSLSVSFSGWSANPAAVDVYVKESSDALKTRVTVSAGKITLDTSYFEPGSYNLYVVSGNVKSNSIEVELMKNALEAPSDVVATVSAATSNTIVIKWTNVSDVSDYWLYCSTTNDLSSATLKTKYAYSGYSFTIIESGTYYFWVKAADSYDSTSPASDFSTVATYTY